VHKFLQEGRLGFLIREDNLVNQVSFPIKFGEYLSAGLHVVSSDFNWAISDFIKSNGGGILIENHLIDKSVDEILRYYYGLDYEDSVMASSLSELLSYERLLTRLISII
jgi:hypothetical protein